MLRFGTDGVRGDADTDLSSARMVALARAVARVLGRDHDYLIGRDTRASGTRIERDLVAGLRSEGATGVPLGVLPTPAIAYSAQREQTPALVVSASHNPWTDNGVKVLGADGRKLPDDVERAIEAQLEEPSSAPAASAAPSDDALRFDHPRADAYLAHLLAALDGRALDGLDVIVDCANGAASEIGPRALRAAGASVSVLHASPDGRNINAECGSTHPDSLRAAVRDRGAQLGLAFDGDADRVLAVDERGELVDGDQIMAMTALDLHARGRLRNDAIAVTVMSNLGLRKALAAAGVRVVETAVGDRYVVTAMEEHDLAVGGEQSGHIVFADLATTGDGVLTGLLVADLVVRLGQPLSKLGACMTRLPQVLVNVRVAKAADLGAAPEVWREVERVEAELGDRGRVLLRASGTEPVIRVMAEAPTEQEAAQAVDAVRTAVVQAFGA